MYDYNTKEEAAKHMSEMKAKGWSVWNLNEEIIEHPEESIFKFTVEYHRYGSDRKRRRA